MLNIQQKRSKSFWKKFILFSCLFLIYYPTFSQNQIVKIKGTDITIKSAFNQIEKQTGLTIAYDESALNVNQRIKGDIKSIKLSEALSEILKDTKLEFLFQNKHVVIRTRKDIPAANNSQSLSLNNPNKIKNISGKVTDAETGEPIIGASVVEKGTTNGIMTDVNGDFKLSIPEDASLSISYIGYVFQEINVAGQTSLNIELYQDSQALDEIVVVGMNIRQTKRSVTGAMSTIKTKELVQTPVANLNNALAGRLPGLISIQSSGQPGDDASSLYIRGISTYGSRRTPLIVIDGLPRGEGDFSQIDPNEVETISILKDASSSALYGIQGANGIIVVTTKRGRDGQKPSIDLTLQTGNQQVMRLPERASLYDNALYFNVNDINNNSIPRFSQEALETIKAGSEPYLYPEVNWFEEILKKQAIQSQYNINISGSSNIVRYFVSGSFINQGSLLKHGDKFFNNYGKKSGFNRYNFRSNIDIEALKGLNVSVDLAVRQEKRTGPASGFQMVFDQLNQTPSFAFPIFNPDGTLGAGSNVSTPYWRNPYGTVTQGGYYENLLNSMYGTISAKYNMDPILKGLSLQGYYSFQNNNFNNTNRTQEFDTYWYRGLNADGLPWYQQHRIATSLGTTGVNTIEQSSYTDLRLIYDNKMVDLHHFTGQILANRTLRTVNSELPYAYQGISARITYGYKSKYFAEVNLGYNGSENFPQDSRYGFFPSGSLGWIVSDEDFLKEVKIIEYLKIRSSIGVSGNDKIGGERWLYLSDYANGGGYTFGLTPRTSRGYLENRVGNPHVTWERSTKGNIGFEFTSIKNIIQLSFDAFYEKRKNILTPPGTIPDYLGIVNLSPLNTGVVENRGFDGELYINYVINKDFRLFSNFQFTYAKNKVIQNDQPYPMFSYQDLRGYDVGYQLGYKSLGLFQTEEEIKNSAIQSFDNITIPGDIKYQDINSDGVIDNFDRIPLKVINVPTFMSGLSLGASFKNLDFSTLLNAALGGTAYFFHERYSKYVMDNYWNENNMLNAKLPTAKRSLNNSLSSDFYLQKTDYLKLRNIEIGYTFNLAKLERLRFFINGQNLFVWDKLPEKDRDPEALSGNLHYPIQRVINFGINLKY